MQVNYNGRATANTLVAALAAHPPLIFSRDRGMIRLEWGHYCWVNIGQPQHHFSPVRDTGWWSGFPVQAGGGRDATRHSTGRTGCRLSLLNYHLPGKPGCGTG